MNISRLPLIQAKILQRLWESPHKMGVVEGRVEGGSIKELSKKGFVEASGKVGRRIRWRLIDSALDDKDIASIKELLGLDQTDYELERWTEGFQIVAGSLNMLCAFLVKKELFIAGFAFRVGYLDWVSRKLKNEEMVRNAESVVKEYMRKGEVKDREELTFEYIQSEFIKVEDPKWWIKSNM